MSGTNLAERGCLLLPLCWLLQTIERAITPPPELTIVSPPSSPASSLSSHDYMSPDEDPDFRAVHLFLGAGNADGFYISQQRPNSRD